MALDGIVVASIANDLRKKLIGGKIDKINQPENDEINLTIRSLGQNHKLLLTANASNPRVHFTDISKNNPVNAPLFCMVLRKYVSGGRIVAINQPNFERIITIDIDSATEMGDITRKRLITEIMGKHSNIILTDANDLILDSIKHIGHDKSSVREVLPGKTYVPPPNQNKMSPLEITEEILTQKMSDAKSIPLQKFLYTTFSGISPIFAGEICSRAKISADSPIENCNPKTIFNIFNLILSEITSNNFKYEVTFDENDKFLDFSALEITSFAHLRKLPFPAVSPMLEYFYKERDAQYHILQKSQDLRRLVSTNIERVTKKIDIYDKSLHDIADRDKYRLYGELITANIYALKKGDKTYTALNFYNDNAAITIPLDETKTPAENAQKHFKRYNKEKRAFAAVTTQKAQAQEELNYLESVLNALHASLDEADLDEIRAELADFSYVKRRTVKKAQKKTKKSKPLSFTSSDGLTIFVGKSNTQNEDLTFGAEKEDIWLHAKDIPGSHVIIKTNGQPVPNSSIEEAAAIAAHFSKARESSLVAVDYCPRRNVKKPSGAKPGFVIYETYRTAFVKPKTL